MRSIAVLLITPVLAACAAGIPVSATVGGESDRLSTDIHTTLQLDWRLIELDNGLTAILQRDPSMPVAAVEMFVRGGAREEVDGQRGFAHLLEHNLPVARRFFSNAENRANRLRLVTGGGAGIEPDFMRFHQVVRPEGLELVLAEFADRAESDSSWFSEAALTRDVDIVVNELRRAWRIDWEPEVEPRLNAGVFGSGHPYGHTIGGREADVQRAKVADMIDWHRRFFGASNIVLVIVGSIDYDYAAEMVHRHFGALRPGAKLHGGDRRIPEPIAGRETVELDVPYSVVYLRWPVPGWGAEESAPIAALVRVLDDRLTRGSETHVGIVRASAGLWSYELAGYVQLEAVVESADAVQQAEDLLRAEAARLLAGAPSESEVARARGRLELDLLRDMQRPVWRGARAELLAMGLMFHGDPDRYRTHLAEVRSTGVEQVTAVAQRWLTGEGYALRVLRRPHRTPSGPADRTASVRIPQARPFAIPVVIERRLPSGLRILAAERPLPVIRFSLFLPATAPDARLARTVEALKAPDGEGDSPLERVAARHGAVAQLDATPDGVLLTGTALAGSIVSAVSALVAVLAAGPSAEAWAANAAGTRRSGAPDLPAVRKDALACLIGRGCVAAAGSAPLAAPHRLAPMDAILVLAGATEEQVDSLAAVLTRWSGGEALPDGSGSAEGEAQSGERALIVDQRGAAQSHILFGQTAGNSTPVDPLMARMVGQALRELLMDNLRYERGWSYEVWPWDAEPGPESTLFYFNLSIRSERLAEGLAEIVREVEALSTRPLPAPLFARVRGFVESDLITNGLSSVEALDAQLRTIGRLGLQLDYYADAHARLHSLTPDELMRAAAELLDAERIVWVVSGDPEAARAAVRTAGLGDAALFRAQRGPE